MFRSVAGAVTILMLAALPVRAAPITCAVAQAPVISIVPTTAQVRFDDSMTGMQLTTWRTSTVSPYASGTETVTGGLRMDRPEVKMEVLLADRSFPTMQIGCLSYSSAKISIHLAPVVYLARERKGTCRNAIIEHELKHVAVDRQVMNDFSQKVGTAVQTAVNETGAIGPFNTVEKERYAKQMQDHVRNAVESQEMLLSKDMAVRQGQVDSLEEYQRVSKICNTK